LFTGSDSGVLSVFNYEHRTKNAKISEFERTFNPIYKIYPLENESVSISSKRELTLWDLNSGKMLENAVIEDMQVKGYIEKCKFNKSENILIVLTSSYELAVFRSFEYINKINLCNDSKIKSEEKNLAILNYSEFEKYDRSKSENVFCLTIFCLTNFDYFELEIKDFTSQNFKVKHNRLVLNTDDKKIFIKKIANNREKLSILIRELNYLILVDKYIQNFNVFSYDDKSTLFLNTENAKNTVRFLNIKDEKTHKQFMQSYLDGSLNHQFRFKIIEMENLELFFVLGVFKYDQQADEYLNVNNSIYSLRIVSTVNRFHERNVELEILSIFPFCRNYNLLKRLNSKIDKEELILTLNHHSPDSQNSSNEIIVFNLTNRMKQMLKINLEELFPSENLFIIKNLCIDSNLEYLIFVNHKKIIHVLRLQDLSLIAQMPLYGQPIQIKFNSSNRLLNLSMNDRRLISLLLVDPDRQDHMNQINQIRVLSEKKDRKEEEIIDLEFNSEHDAKARETFMNKNERRILMRIESLYKTENFESKSLFLFIFKVAN
jgi:hypothetical protein